MSFARRSDLSKVNETDRPEASVDFPRTVSEGESYLQALPVPAASFRSLPGQPPEILAFNQCFPIIGPNGDLSAQGATGRMLRDPKVANAIAAFLESAGGPVKFEWRDGDDGGRHHYTVGLSTLANGPGGSRDWLATFIDRTAAVEAERSLRAEMLRDSLTGLPNRSAFIEAVDTAIINAGDTRDFAVLIIDLTRFSRVNESMGSLAGDELIITVARRLVSALRSGDLLARLGGDEFAVLLRLGEGPDDALHAARRIHTALLTPFRLSELEIRIDCAIGCSLMTEAATMAEDLVRNAQFAMKRAKQSGRVEVYQPGEVALARRRFSLETELRRVIEAGGLKLAFQPLIDLQADKIAGFEALTRWEHPELGQIPPNDFIAVAEESGLIVPLGRWAINEATRTLAHWDNIAGQVLPIYVAVNVSAVQLVRDDLAAIARSALETSRLHGNRLMLELTESAIIADPERSGRMLKQLKALDATIAMDDFGTGYSSLAYLQRLPIDVLKIDRSFVTGMLADRDSVAIVRAILSLASALGMQTTAEGVETAELAQTLAALGCSYGQGYHFSRPLTADDAFAYCRRAGIFTTLG